MRPTSERQATGVSVSGEVAAGSPCRSLVVPPRQAQVLRFIENSPQSPTILEIREHLGVSALSTVHKHLRELQRKRLVEWTPHAQRSLKTSGGAQAASPRDATQSTDSIEGEGR